MPNEREQHTPGPWLHRGKSDSVHRPSPTHPYGETIFRFDEEEGPCDADLALILASPELLAALKIARQFMSIASDWNIDEAEIDGEMRSTYDWLEVVDKAIAKAVQPEPCYCDQRGIGEPGVTCGDCPRDYVKAQAVQPS